VPRVSVILNSYNQEEYLERAIRSVLSQTFADFELIITDNGSTDGSAALISKFADDTRVIPCLHDRNDAISRRFNEALAIAGGEFVAFLYSDDRYLPHKLALQVQLFEQEGADVGMVYAPSLFENQRTLQTWSARAAGISGPAFEALLNWRRSTDPSHPDMISPLTRRACFDMHPFYEDVFAEGEAVFLRVALTHEFRFRPEPVAVLSDHLGNRGKAIATNLEINRTVLGRLREHPRLPADGSRLIDGYETALFATYAWQGARVGADSTWVRGCARAAVAGDLRALLDRRVVPAFALASVPNPVRRRLNHWGDVIRNSKQESVLVDGYA
jgi:glycosyltransferase involved in cell wall biosynthesis